MDNSISDMFSTSDITFDSSNITTNNEFDHLRIIFEEVLCTVSFVDVEENVFKDEIPKLKQTCIETMDKIQEYLKVTESNNELLEEVIKLIQKYISLLNFTHSAVKYITSRVHITQVRSLPLAVSEILLQAFKHCKESDTLYGKHFISVRTLLTDLFKKANELQSCFLTLLNNNLIFDLREEEQIVYLVQVAEILATIGEIVSGLDINTTAKLWKAYLVLLQKHNEYLKTRINIEPVLKYFCSEIINSLNSVGINSDIKTVEKTLKISSFNLKIVIKLCSLYESCGESTPKLFDLLVTLNRYSIPYLKFRKMTTKFIDLMQVYVSVASEPLLNCLIDNRTFVEYYFKNIKNSFEDDNKRFAAIFLTISLIKKNLNSDTEIKKLWISDDTTQNIIFVLYSSLDEFHIELSLDFAIQIQRTNGDPTRITSLYEYILIHLVSIIITTNSKQFKLIQKLLFSSIMQTDPWKAMFSSDIWIALGRFGSVEFCFESLIFLIEVFVKFQDYNRPEIIYLRTLIPRNYSILSDKYKSELINRYPYNKYLKLWSVIGFKNEPSLNAKIQNFIDQLIKLIDQFLGNKNIESFKSMNELLGLLSTNTFIESNEIQVKNIINRLMKLWSLNIDSQIHDQLWIINFVNIRTKITSRLLKHFSNEELLKILQSLKEQNIKDSKPSICLFLKSLASKQIHFSPEQKNIFDTISKIFNTLLTDNNPVIKQQAFESFRHFAYHTCHEDILANIVEGNLKLQEEISNYLQKLIPETNLSQFDYFKEQRNIPFRHKCCEEFSEPVQKKKKLDSNVNVSGIIQNMKFNCDSLVEFYKNDTVPENVLNELNIICSKLQLLLNK